MDIDRQLLEKYFKGLCTSVEQELVEAYLAQPDHTVLDAYLEEQWQEPAPVVKVRKMYRWRYAAAAILVLLAGGGLWWMKGGIRTNPLAQRWDTLRNARSTVKLVVMPDGSKVWLNAYTTLVFGSGYNRGDRELWLEGEAYFEAAKNSSLPFRVHAGGLVTTVLGTAFNIVTGKHTEVSLLEGKVAVSDSSVSFTEILQPGQMLSYHADKHLYDMARFDKNKVLDWKNGKLLFDRSPLEEVFAKLERRYGTKITLEYTRIAQKKITGEFNANEPLEDIMANLQYVHRFRCVKAADGSWIVRKP